MNILLDTTALIHILKGDSSVINKIEEARKTGTVIYTTAVNIYEITRGIKLLNREKEEHLNALRILISNIRILDFDLKACESASDIYASLRKTGVQIGPADYLIAGIALSNGITSIITKNERHFGKIKGLEVIAY